MAKVILPTLRYSQSPKTIRVQSRKDCVDGEGKKKERIKENRKHIASRLPSSHHVKLEVCFVFLTVTVQAMNSKRRSILSPPPVQARQTSQDLKPGGSDSPKWVQQGEISIA